MTSPNERDQLERLEQLQHACKGQGKDNLYHLIGVQGAPPDHNMLRTRLAKKRDSWSKMAGKAAQLEIVERALDLLETPGDKTKYDAILAESQAPTQPLNPQQGRYRHGPTQPPPHRDHANQPPWGHRERSGPQRTSHQRRPRQPMGALLWLLLFVVGAGTVVQLSTDMWNRFSSSMTALNGPSEPAATDEEDVIPAAGTRSTAGETRRPSSPSREAVSSASTDDGGGTGTSRPDAAEEEAGATTRGNAASPSAAEPIVRPAPPGPSGDPSSARTARAGSTTLPPEGAVVSRAAPDPVPVVEPVRVGGNVAQPTKTWSVTPEYPRLARLRRVQGVVILEVTVDRQGDVADVTVLRSADGLDEAAVEAVRQWRYEPTLVNGRPVSVVLTETVRFQL